MQIVLAMQPDTSINPFIEHKYSTAFKVHADKNLFNENQYRVLKKCYGKFACLAGLRNAVHQN